MIFQETKLPGAFVLNLERRADSRGFFARCFCQREFIDHGLEWVVAQTNMASNIRKGTVRGMHFRFPPQRETKLVRCTRGAILDVIVDLRPESPTYLEHVAVELTADNATSLYVPARFAHGYQVLTDGTDVTYQTNEFYEPGVEFGLLHDDPHLAIRWPLPISVVSDRDREFANLRGFEPQMRSRMTLPSPPAYKPATMMTEGSPC